MPSERLPCDIVIPVYGGVHFIHDLLRSIERATEIPYRVLLIDDSDDAATYAQLEEFVEHRDSVELHRNKSNLGFVATSNRGFDLCRSEFICLLNSDTLVSNGWLERMIACAETDSQIAVVNPVSNRAANLSVAFAPGLGLNTMAHRLARSERRRIPDITTAVGFCMLIRRSHLLEHGGFDPIFGHGYCEESDFCMRMTEAGLRVVLAEDAFVYHKGEGSFDAREERYRENRKVFDARWSEAYSRDYAAFLERNPLQDIRDELLTDTILDSDWSPRTQRKRELSPGDDSLDPRPRSSPDPEQRRVRFPTRAYIDALDEIRLPPADDGEPALRITFIVGEMPIAGGVIAIVQLAREMMLAGHDVRIVTAEAREVDPERFNLPLQPIVYPTRKELIRLFPKSDIVVSTYWTTVSDYVEELRKRQDFLSVYYVQDYEVEFFEPADRVRRHAAGATYRVADEVLVESAWVEEKIRENHGVCAHRVSLGMNRGVFWDRSSGATTRGGASHERGPGREGTMQEAGESGRRSRVLSVARPADRRRGFLEAVHIFERIHQVRPDVELVFFGTPDEEMPAHLPFPYRNEGRIQDQDRVARLVSSADVLLDSSLFQGFGRPGLEAMACGTPCVLTSQGGIHEYARHNENCLMVDSRLTGPMSAAILRLLEDSALRQRFREAGLRTAAEFDLRDAARQHLGYYREWTKRGSTHVKTASR